MLLLGEPPERVDVPPGSVVVVPVGTPIQLVNERDEDSLALIVGAPPTVWRHHGLMDELERLAEVAVVVGANVQPGQVVRVTAEVEQVAVVQAVADAAYRHGAHT